MTWLRIHDGFTQNSKIAQLTDAQFRVWMRLLCYCGSSRDPTVDSVALREISGLDRRRVRTYLDLGLLDEIGDDFEIHDWSKYMPKEEQNAARQAKWRGRKRNADSNASRNGKVTPEASRTRAGTRGVPSRPEDQDQEPDQSTVVQDEEKPPMFDYDSILQDMPL